MCAQLLERCAQFLERCAQLSEMCAMTTGTSRGSTSHRARPPLPCSDVPRGRYAPSSTGHVHMHIRIVIASSLDTPLLVCTTPLMIHAQKSSSVSVDLVLFHFEVDGFVLRPPTVNLGIVGGGACARHLYIHHDTVHRRWKAPKWSIPVAVTPTTFFWFR